jgi:hypothetical protein
MRGVAARPTRMTCTRGVRALRVGMACMRAAYTWLTSVHEQDAWRVCLRVCMHDVTVMCMCGARA